MAVTNEVIGHTACPDCKATVENRINKNRKVYWHCDGRAHDMQCNAAFKHGAAVSRKMIAEAAKFKTANDNNEPQQEQENNNDGKEQQAGNDTRNRGFGLFGG